ncbi:MAG: biopolymer transporter ExbD [Candidatus Latescibacteria bacterium]|nr:biopolymer transporter ExbD [Candidatus Latescibacterota bacterium]
MAMAVGGRRGPTSDINVTPLVDVVLVLLIIFMVITPVLLKSLEADLPKQGVASSSATVQRDITVAVSDDNVVTIDGVPMPTDDALGQKIKELFPPAAAEKRVLFNGGKKASYEKVIRVMDVLRGNGVEVVGIR